MNYSAINFEEKFSQFSEYWSPKIIAQMNDYHFKLAKLQGSFVWHRHANTDEVFIVLDGEMSTQFRDGQAAKMFPDVTFIIYHSGIESAAQEGAYNPNAPRARGIDTLIKSLLDNDVPPNSNVYAELGTTWRQVMRTSRAAHVLGKLLRYVGEDRVLWGTDSIWYGSPQDQIEVFRAFQISEQLQEQNGYPALTPELKAKIFGLNATVPYGINPTQALKRLQKDEIQRRKIEYQNNRQPSLATYGPKTRREFLSFLRLHGGRPG
jgi:hypothetical protein